MTDQTAPNSSAGKTVTVSQDDELRLNAGVYQPHFTNTEYARLGTHPNLDLIFVRPVTVETGDPPKEVTEFAYKIDDTRYTGEITCRRFLQQHNYHHTTTTRYVAEWWPEPAVLCIDLTDPAPMKENP
ncbi:hypothetical protein DU484_07310 [Haloplanus rubicundus]|uniref:Uncharacterized protein n=1 Tax=Haloplanus rubicundus TaxID=1547898 RepID=A0A345EBW3_9EURY|nr:hypothetical protein DU484_07310 [Haloplanus rubicundus]